MNIQAQELTRLLKTYGGDRKKLLAENPTLENLRVFSDRREGLLSWYGFVPGKKLLSVGSGWGSLLDLYARRRLSVTVLEADENALAFVKERVKTERAGNAGSGTAAGGTEGAGNADSVAVAVETAVAGKTDGTSAGETEDTAAAGLRLLGGTFSDLPETERFDYIVFDGTLDEESGVSQIAEAKKRLAPDGVLIVSADNAFGVRAFAGAKKEPNAMGRRALEQLLAAGGAGNVSWYYPEPLRALPDVIFSDRRLPEEGELSRVIPAYGFPMYLAIDIGAKYDEVCRGGMFPQLADSFLCFWTRKARGAADSAVYIKFNRNRRETYRLSTAIRETAEGLSVEKSALSAAGAQHIRDFSKRREILLRENRGISYAAPEFRDGGRTAVFPFVEGRSLTALILDEIRRGRTVRDVVSEALERLTGGAPVHNLDSIFDNFLVTEDGSAAEEANSRIGRAALTGIDYEWVKDEPADRNFVRYRALTAFYEQQREPLGLGEKQAFLSAFGIDEAEAERLSGMEKDFQSEVSGDEQSVYLDRFVVEQRDAATIEKTERDLRIANERLDGFRAELRDNQTTIRKMTEVKRLTDNHVTNLGIIIDNLRHENSELGKTLTYLNSHQTLYSRLRRKAGDAFNKKYPKGSVQRKLLEYRKDAVLHPIRHHRLVSTEEGRNLIEGDLAIGSIYREHGRLHFPAEEHPLVSIVIPVYNQISYTYTCLVSILEHTKGIPYEVIIADDVSTDATEHLADFAEGLVISRNKVNQGFLRNCNQAAAKARGDFIFFLNNDTTVTDGWLEWLLKLMREDRSIGMAGSKLVYPDGRLQEAGGIIWSDGSGWNYGRLQNPDLPEYNYVKDVDYISGAAILIRTSLWKEIGGFDERYAPAYCEDSDLAFEVRRHGYRVVYQPKSVVVHYEGVSNGTDVQGTGLKRYQVQNTEKLKEKWKAELKEQFENDGNPDPFRARERSKGKKIILVVDHYVPTFDRDAGSRTTWQYLQMFVKKGFQVKFLGDNFAHEEPYTTALEQIGIEVLYGQEMQAGIWQWIEQHEKDLHLVYLNRPHIAVKYIDFIQSRTHLKVLYYGHDLHFLRERREYEITGDRKLRESAAYWKTLELSLMHKADMSFYPSEVECAAIHRIDPEIRVKALTAYLWDTFPDDIETDYEKREGLLFVGGFAHPPNADAVLWFLKEIWPKIREEKKITFHVVGSRAPEEITALDSPENGIRIHGFVSDEELRSLYNSCRIVIVPLRYGAGVKGKVIEALYYGAPVLTTSVGAEGIPDAEQVMRIADTPEDIVSQVLALYDDTAELKNMTERAKTYIRTHNSLDAAWDVVKEDFA